MYTNGAWHPLDELYDLADYLPQPPEADESAVELATSFRERKPIPGFRRLPRGRTASGVPGISATRKRAMRWLKIIVATVILLCGAFATLWLRNFVNNEFSALQVLNLTGKDIAVYFADSGRGEVTVKPGKHVNFNDLVMAFPGRKKLRHRFLDAKENKPEVRKVHCAPGHDTLAIIGTARLHVYRSLSNLALEQLPAQNVLSELASQIAEGRTPDAASTIEQQLRRRLDELHAGLRHEDEYSSRDYNLEYFNINPGHREKAPDRTSLPYLLPPGDVFVNTATASLLLNNGHKTFTLTGTMPKRKYKANGKVLEAAATFSIVSAPDSCTVKLDCNGWKYLAVRKSGKWQAGWSSK
jgi:hypothetical protein